MINTDNYIKEKKKQLTKILYSSKRKLKQLAEKHNTKDFINKSNMYVRVVETIVYDIKFSDYVEFKNILYKWDAFQKYVDDCWKYCQGDNRISI